MRSAFLCTALLVLAACGSFDPATRNARVGPDIVAPAPDHTVVETTVVVPESLLVSEANILVPLADIVWRGDAPGDRHDQVRALFETALPPAGPSDGMPVHAVIEVTRFHGLTERARYLTGGRYAISFVLTLTDPATGTVIAPPRLVRADLRAFGSPAGLAADSEKALILRHLTGVLAAELGRPLA